ncbi:hypothetical protein GCM10010911_48690 [Paenibacillus nasutitermitis]|uniref:LacI family transcriptional regulator n=1 Tax=Paenibacillus nasutitermitis TaxID=1652958 RepID=A0A916ZAQ0_9BACL|nr:hypothetical protein GCM10010911_48690 [Paenibacillus nasutitermitis]
MDKISLAISCVHLNPTLLGAEAFKLLMDVIDHKPQLSVKKSVTLPAEIIERESTKRQNR